MSFVLGTVGEERHVNIEKQPEASMKEVIAYSGEKVVFHRTGMVAVYYDGNAICVAEGDGTVTKLYNAVVVVSEK